MKNPSDDIVNSLIPKYILGEISAEERDLVDNWVKTEPENEKLFQEFQKVWEYAGQTDLTDEILPKLNIDDEWDHQLKLIVEEKVEVKEISIAPQNSSFTWLRVAASIVLVMVAGFSAYYFMGGFGTSYYAEEETEEVSFKDGTVVTLNTGSEISFKKSYNKNSRIVKFEGEAFFDVSPDTEKPFIIETVDARIRVVGTSFNVRAIPSEEIVEVTVTSGEVLLLNKSGDKAVALKVHDKGTYNRSTDIVTRIDNNNPNFISWKTRVIEFEDSSLEKVVETLNRIYPGKQISLKTSETGDCSITVSFEGQSLDAILNVLESTLDIEYQINEDTIEIIGAGC